MCLRSTNQIFLFFHTVTAMSYRIMPTRKKCQKCRHLNTTTESSDGFDRASVGVTGGWFNANGGPEHMLTDRFTCLKMMCDWLQRKCIAISVGTTWGTPSGVAKIAGLTCANRCTQMALVALG